MFEIVFLVSVVLGLLIFKLYLKLSTAHCYSQVCLKGKTVLVTGANSGKIFHFFFTTPWIWFDISRNAKFPIGNRYKVVHLCTGPYKEMYVIWVLYKKIETIANRPMKHYLKLHIFFHHSFSFYRYFVTPSFKNI